MANPAAKYDDPRADSGAALFLSPQARTLCGKDMRPGSLLAAAPGFPKARAQAHDIMDRLHMTRWQNAIPGCAAAVLGLMVFALSGILASGTAHATTPAPKGDSVQTAAETGQSPSMTRVAIGNVKDNDHVLGDPDAPVTIIEYASMTCPHCASFHAETLPKLKKNFIDTGKAKLVFRHYPLDNRALQASVLAECFEGGRFFAMLDILFQQQQRWARADDMTARLGKLAGMAGLAPEDFDQCMKDEATVDRILSHQMKARNNADIQSTPSFIIDGETIAGNPGYEALAEKIRAAE